MTKRVLHNAAAWSGDGVDHHAIAIEGGVIVALDDAAVRWGRDHDAEFLDLAGGFVMPAFADGHAHPLFGGLESDGPSVRGHDSIAGIVAAVRQYAAEHPDLEWIVGASYESSLSPAGLFDARWLDEAVSDRPVLLRAWDYHTVWVNTRALELAGIRAETPDPALGEIPRRDDGSALGTLREWGAIDLVTAVMPRRSLEARIAAIERAGRHYASLGITWVQDAWVEPEQLEAYLAAAQADRLPIRFNLALYADPRHWPGTLEVLIEGREQVRRLGHPLLTANTVKFFADGVVENATAALLEPYMSEPGNTGMLVWSAEGLAEAVAAVDAAGFQPHIHTIGDGAVRLGLDAVEHAERQNGTRDRRAVLAHVQLVDEADLDRFARLDVTANAEPLWAQLDPLMNVLTVPRLGEKRSAAQYQLSTLTSRGARLSFGSDWPVSSADPLEGLAVACSRQTQERQPSGGWTPHERLRIEAALLAYTAGVAHQAFRTAGLLQVGHDADLVVLSGDPRTVTDPRDLDTLHVTSTWLDGECIFAATEGTP
ncbi:amidohydrolase [Humibacillus sp. DSM 29435]|uniref:amidohydrolase n=1 Tax=Humibacillus sp. DSM 29435 TaxID=1869167 RepID=UPI0008728118|nr:amidohydrolase [Humibacillus sp. DSM 29435]OFE16228.1 amidohydrolase [Humibacillus sp. DSM 29435]